MTKQRTHGSKTASPMLSASRMRQIHKEIHSHASAEKRALWLQLLLSSVALNTALEISTPHQPQTIFGEPKVMGLETSNCELSPSRSADFNEKGVTSSMRDESKSYTGGIRDKALIRGMVGIRGAACEEWRTMLRGVAGGDGGGDCAPLRLVRMTDVVQVCVHGVFALHTLYPDLLVDGVLESLQTTAVHTKAAWGALATAQALVVLPLAAH
eukprot:IDg5843t1